MKTAKLGSLSHPSRKPTNQYSTSIGSRLPMPDTHLATHAATVKHERLSPSGGTPMMTTTPAAPATPALPAAAPLPANPALSGAKEEAENGAPAQQSASRYLKTEIEMASIPAESESYQLPKIPVWKEKCICSTHNKVSAFLSTYTLTHSHTHTHTHIYIYMPAGTLSVCVCVCVCVFLSRCSLDVVLAASLLHLTVRHPGHWFDFLFWSSPPIAFASSVRSLSVVKGNVLQRTLTTKPNRSALDAPLLSKPKFAILLAVVCFEFRLSCIRPVV
jgi:hypothetical protein